MQKASVPWVFVSRTGMPNGSPIPAHGLRLVCVLSPVSMILLVTVARVHLPTQSPAQECQDHSPSAGGASTFGFGAAYLRLPILPVFTATLLRLPVDLGPQ
jgi:hypothetical protein